MTPIFDLAFNVAIITATANLFGKLTIEPQYRGKLKIEPQTKGTLKVE